MRKVIAAINMTIDGNFDHTAGIPDEEIHDHYTNLLDAAGIVLYGRKTFELMKYWQTLLEKPSGERSMDEFAIAINKVPKLVFSNTLKETGWASAEIATRALEEELMALKQEQGSDILVGSRSLITQILNLGLIDEFQLCIQPVLAGKGLTLFEDTPPRLLFDLVKTTHFKSGAVILYYIPKK